MSITNIGRMRRRPTQIEGAWLGGLQIDGSWSLAAGEIKTEPEAPRVDLYFLEQNASGPVQVKGSEVRFRLETKSGACEFEGQIKERVLRGRVHHAGKAGTFELFRQLNLQDMGVFEGFYRAFDQSLLYVQRWDEIGGPKLVSLDDAGQLRTLFPAAEFTFITGPSLVRSGPAEATWIFTADKGGNVTALRRRWANETPEVLTKVALHDREDVKFRSGELTLGGSLFVPRTKGPHPVVIITHGSGPQDRNAGLLFNAMLLLQGVALFAYDKRGVGESGGSWLASFEDLAGDVQAAVEFLKNHRVINPRQIGVWGLSQGGWIAPLAATRCPDIAFVIAVSAAAVTPAQQELTRVEFEMRATGYADEDIQAALRLQELRDHYTRTGEGWDEYLAARQKAKGTRWGPSGERSRDDPEFRYWRAILDYDPMPVLRKLACPVLVAYGGLDQNVQPAINRPIMEKALRESGNKDCTVIVHPKANHIMLEGATGSNEELASIQRFVPEYLSDVSAWILKRVTIPQ